MKQLGGYFGLEVNQGNEYHPNAIKLNSGRHCLEHVIKSNQIENLYIPYYICPEIVNKLKKLNVKIIMF